MIPRPVLYLIAGFAAVLFIAWGVDSCERGRGVAQDRVVQQHVQEGNQHEGAARAYDAQVPDLKAELQAAQDRVDHLKAEAESLRKRLASPQTPVPAVEPADVSHWQGMVADRDALILKQGEIIAAQDTEIAQAKEALGVALKARDEWKGAFESERKARQAQEAGTEAWKKAVVASRWAGRLEGFAVGATAGYLAGRLR